VKSPHQHHDAANLGGSQSSAATR
jgi:hypothetical protein